MSPSKPRSSHLVAVSPSAVELLPSNWHQLDLNARVSALVDHDRVAEIVPILPADELFHLVRATGFDTSLTLLEHVSADQWKAFIDIDGWNAGEVSLDRFERWMQAAEAAGSEVPEELLASVDDEYLVLLLQQGCTIHENDLDPDFVPDDRDLFQSPDGQFWIEMPADHPDIAFMRRSLHQIFSRGIERGRRLLRAARWEIPSALTAEATQFREARLADLGYPSWDDAMERMRTRVELSDLQAMLAEDGEQPMLQRVRPDELAPSALAPWSPVRSTPLLQRALGQVDDPESRDAIAEGFAGLAHAFTVAHQLDIGEWDDHMLALERVYGLVNLGLHRLAEAEMGQAELSAEWPSSAWLRRALTRIHLTWLFRAGQTAVTDLAARARRLRSRVGGPDALGLFGEPTLSTIQVLSYRIPSAFGALDQDGAPVPEAFRDPAQLRDTEAVLERGEAIVEYFEDHIGFDPKAWAKTEFASIDEDSRQFIRFDSLFLTSLAHRLADGAFSIVPLTSDQLARAVELLLEPNPSEETGRRELRPNVSAMLQLQASRAAAAENPSVARHAKHVGAFVREALARLVDELGGLPAGQAPDPRYLAGLVLVENASD